ncbi:MULTISPECIES: DUF484 family protein [Marichromatium]|uniref:DUF484 family protein n=1 Tax=Marichromatium gracile TaxID=1048 RepID=A0A4R4AJQ1_MARGR|nr:MULTISPECIES: DUF484 family protein [Marichromatium]MBK1710439.1 hypothetical protein [Marichromatium gracile]MBO8085506.1 DUF484 family protein [Marichromatium sp.]RNE92644.1 DUF484 family protein [Marichromatium sp. AB32]TCW39617.1 hypothetical protein EDC29_10129 [Marichromatium gracile]
MITQAEQPETRDEALEATVAAYLQRHPDFFEHHPEILITLRIPHPTGDAVSLIERQVRALRQELDTERQRLGQLIARAREYESLSTRLHALVLRLIAINDPDRLCEETRETLLQEFRADAVTLKLFPLDPETAAPDPLTAAFKDFLARKHALCGPLDADKAEVLFGEAAASVRTAALVPIRTAERSGVLAIGSSDPERFRPELGTDLLDRLGEIIAHKLSAVTIERCGRD